MGKKRVSSRNRKKNSKNGEKPSIPKAQKQKLKNETIAAKNDFKAYMKNEHGQDWEERNLKDIKQSFPPSSKEQMVESYKNYLKEFENIARIKHEASQKLAKKNSTLGNKLLRFEQKMQKSIDQKRQQSEEKERRKNEKKEKKGKKDSSSPVPRKSPPRLPASTVISDKNKFVGDAEAASKAKVEKEVLGNWASLRAPPSLTNDASEEEKYLKKLER